MDTITAPPASSTVRIDGSEPALRECVCRATRRYLESSDGCEVSGLYAFVLEQIEQPLFAEVMRHFDGNQTRAAEALGINRATLRKKLRAYGLA